MILIGILIGLAMLYLASGLIIGANRRENAEISDMWSRLNQPPVPASITVQQVNPRIRDYRDWNVRMDSQGDYRAVPLIPDPTRKGAIMPYWPAADPVRFAHTHDGQIEAWEHAMELSRAAKQLAIDA